jgi:hypothetical protein
METKTKRSDHRPNETRPELGEGWYVIHQGSNIKVEHHRGTPNTQHEPGEKMIRASGPYANEATANKVVDRMRGKVERRPIRRRGSK